MVENYVKDLKETVYHGAVISALAIGFKMIGKSKMIPPHLWVSLILKMAKLVTIIVLSDFPKDYLIKKKIIPDSI